MQPGNYFGLNELREMFLSFFEEKGHLRLPGFSLIPKGDASLLLINSGMAPMKTWFTGEQEPPRKRVCTCQKCIRTIDIENVGKTSRHGTYFEMLGNFSFGDYFKKESLAWTWEFLTERLGLPADRLYPSVFEEDDEAFDIWVNDIGIAPERISKLGREDNFWEQGSGPCGPNSEVYYDRGAGHGCGSPGCAPGCDCDRYVEIWNNVFTQFDTDGEGNYTELTQKNIDTGMGLERLACICQGVDNMFEVDTVMNIIRKLSSLCGVAYGSGAKSDVSVRIITDHIRGATMMICDGVLPSNEGRGYVLRRLLRRAARQGRLLGIPGAFLCEVCSVVIDENKGAYPDLVDKSGYIKRVISTEEESFEKTIDAGITMLGGFIDKLKAAGETVLSGADTFKLYDTFGFPLDLTVDILAENGMTADTEGFDKQMEEQRSRARKAREALGDLAWERVDPGLDSTPTRFTGYERRSDTASVLAIVTEGGLRSELGEGGEGYIVLDKTPFYAEMGGQSADTGTISRSGKKPDAEAVFDVSDVQQSKAGKYLHHGKMRGGSLSVGDMVDACINNRRRDGIARAHSATHLMHKALRTVLGSHVNQAGSLVEPDKLRFDFTHFAALTEDEISRIEQIVNEAILENHGVRTDEMPVDEAKKLGAAALFGEKYGSIVRVVRMGDSIELCGGTHLDCTARAGMFAILSEFSVAAGVRRIEAVTGPEALEILKTARRQLHDIAGVLKANTPDEIIGKIEQNIAMLRKLRSKLESAESKESGAAAKDLLAGAKDVGGLKIIAAITGGPDAGSDKLRQMQDTLRDMEPAVVAVLAANTDGKIAVTASCGRVSVEKGIRAGDLIREVMKICGGGGGGKPEFAMGGGKDNGKLQEALAYVDKYVEGKLK